MVARYTVWVWQTYVEVGRVDNWCLAGHGILGNRTVSLSHVFIMPISLRSLKWAKPLVF